MWWLPLMVAAAARVAAAGMVAVGVAAVGVMAAQREPQ